MTSQNGGQSLRKHERKKSVKQNGNYIKLCILPFYTTIFTTAFRIVQIVDWFSQNHITANLVREPHVIWQRPLFSLSPSHRAPRAFSFLPSLPTIKRLLRPEERVPLILQKKISAVRRLFPGSSLQCSFSTRGRLEVIINCVLAFHC